MAIDLSKFIGDAQKAWAFISPLVTAYTATLDPTSESAKVLTVATTVVQQLQDAHVSNPTELSGPKVEAAINAVLPHVQAIMPAPFGSLLGLAASLAEAGIDVFSNTPVDVVVAPTQPGAPPAKVDGIT